MWILFACATRVILRNHLHKNVGYADNFKRVPTPHCSHCGEAHKTKVQQTA